MSILHIRQFARLVLMGIFLVVTPLFGQNQQKNEATGNYKILLNEPHQYIWGLGFEIQSDAIASGNQGLPEETTSVPHDLVSSERRRLSEEMLKGFRYCRLAGGLYYRGTTEDQKELRPRWNSQLLEIKSMLDMAGVEGLSLEYWSPTPFWKANGQYPQTEKNDPLNKLKCFADGFKNDPDYHGDTLKFLNDFGESLVHDIQYLDQNGLKVMFWGLENEPPTNTTYSTCAYSPDEYYLSFKTIAPKIKAYNPNIAIIADSWKGPQLHSKKIAADPEARQYVDAWVWHQIGQNSNGVISKRTTYLENTHCIPVFQNEYEYLQGGTSPERCLNTVQNMMNWFTFVDSPTWFWIHALKPTYNEEASGYSLGFWRPWDDEKTTDIEKGHWKYNNYNWFALAGFLKYMPWESRRYAVQEDTVRNDNRILCFKTPKGKLVLVLTNRSGKDFTYNIDAGENALFHGYRYTPEDAGINDAGVPVGNKKGNAISVTVPSEAWEFWIEN